MLGQSVDEVAVSCFVLAPPTPCSRAPSTGRRRNARYDNGSLGILGALLVPLSLHSLPFPTLQHAGQSALQLRARYRAQQSTPSSGQGHDPSRQVLKLSLVYGQVCKVGKPHSITGHRRRRKDERKKKSTQSPHHQR